MTYGTANVDVIQSSTAGTPPQFNDGNGTQVGTLCRAWVNFNGTTSPGTIRAAYNVGSVTKNGTGDYTVNFTNALPDANYSVNGSVAYAAGGDSSSLMRVLGINSAAAPTTTALRVNTTYANTSLQDCAIVCVSIFR